MSFATTPAAASGLALARAAESMLRALGGSEVALRFTSPDDSSDEARQLGTAAPLVTDVTLAPVLVRSLPPDTPRQVISSHDGQPKRTGTRLELLFPASSIAVQVEARQLPSAEALFTSALGVVHQGRFLRIERVAPEYFAGAAYLYAVMAVE